MPQPFHDAVMTNSGAALLTRAQAGECKIQLTRIAIGDGTYTEAEETTEALQARTELKSMRNSYELLSKNIYSDYSVRVTALLTNKDPLTGETLVTEAYYINEMGLYAKEADGSDDTEILYSITTTTGDHGDLMPPYNGYSPAQITQEYYATVNNSLEVLINTVGSAIEQAIDNAIAENTAEWEETINAAVEAEAEAREAAISEAISAEAEAREAADADLQTSIEAETKAREAADNNLSKDISAEKTARETADNSINAALITETAAREAAYAELKAAVEAAQKAADTAQAYVDSLAKQFAEFSSTISAVPSQNGSLTYNGQSQSPTWNSYDSSVMTIGGTTTGTNAGTYTATFTPKDGYYWSDGTSGAVSVQWTISKAAPTLSLSATSLTLDDDTPQGTIAITYNGDGSLSATSSDTNIATVSISGTTATVKALHIGTAVITVSASEGSNYLSASSICTIESTCTSPLYALSWEEISEISAAGQGPDYFSIGDVKRIHIEGTVGVLAADQDYLVYIIGFDHNAELEGKGITFGGFKTADSEMIDVPLFDGHYTGSYSDASRYFNINHYGVSSTTANLNYGGWRGCDLRYDILGSTDVKPDDYNGSKSTSSMGYDATETCATSPVSKTLMAALPEDLRAQMKPMTIYTNGRGGNSPSEEYIVATVDYLPLLAEYEIYGECHNASPYEADKQKQYEYFANGGSFVKYNPNSKNLDSAICWTRSASIDSSYRFCATKDSEDVCSPERTCRCLGIAPIFRV